MDVKHAQKNVNHIGSHRSFHVRLENGRLKAVLNHLEELVVRTGALGDFNVGLEYVWCDAWAQYLWQRGLYALTPANDYRLKNVSEIYFWKSAGLFFLLTINTGYQNFQYIFIQTLEWEYFFFSTFSIVLWEELWWKYRFQDLIEFGNILSRDVLACRLQGHQE